MPVCVCVCVCVCVVCVCLCVCACVCVCVYRCTCVPYAPNDHICLTIMYMYMCMLCHPPLTSSTSLPPLLLLLLTSSSSSPFRSALYANNLYLSQYRTLNPALLAHNTQGGPRIIGDVRIHPSAQIHPSAVVSHVITAPPLNTLHPLYMRAHTNSRITTATAGSQRVCRYECGDKVGCQSEGSHHPRPSRNQSKSFAMVTPTM